MVTEYGGTCKLSVADHCIDGSRLRPYRQLVGWVKSNSSGAFLAAGYPMAQQVRLRPYRYCFFRIISEYHHVYWWEWRKLCCAVMVIHQKSRSNQLAPDQLVLRLFQMFAIRIQQWTYYALAAAGLHSISIIHHFSWYISYRYSWRHPCVFSLTLSPRIPIFFISRI